MQAEPLVRVVRSRLEESVHLGHAAVCNADGRLVGFAGDPDRLVFARSCMKPLQAAVSLKAIGEAERLPDRELAIMCASHNGEPVHIGAVRAVLERAGLGPSALQNPPGWPLDEESMARAQHKNPLLHNCSGKHAGMLLACVRAGWDPGTYRRKGHALQKRILRAVQRVSGVDGVVVGVDGCGVPVHGMPLRAVATLYARLARPEGLGDLSGEVERAVEAMLGDPYLVGGRGAIDTALMQGTGDVMAKRGAEALECAAALDPGLGVAVKIADGGSRAGSPALLSALRQVGAITGEQMARLSSFSHPSVLGGGEPVGELLADFTLRRPR